MATSTATIFKPYADDFGHLTLNATLLGDEAFGGKSLSPNANQIQINVMFMLAFLVALIVAAGALYGFDKVVFDHPHAQTVTQQSGAVDYD